MRGRKPKPDALKVYPRDRSGASESIAAEADSVSEFAKAPAHLDDVAKVKWKEICAEMIDLKILRVGDYALIEMYCQAWSTWMEYDKLARKTGHVLTGKDGGTYQNPAYSVANKAADRVESIAEKLGLSPTARTRVSNATKAKAGQGVRSRERA